MKFTCRSKAPWQFRVIKYAFSLLWWADHCWHFPWCSRQPRFAISAAPFNQLTILDTGSQQSWVRRKERHLCVKGGRGHVFSTVRSLVRKCEQVIQRMWWRKEDTQRHNTMKKRRQFYDFYICSSPFSLPGLNAPFWHLVAQRAFLFSSLTRLLCRFFGPELISNLVA